MRVLFINGRPDDRLNPGGDTVQLRQTKAALERLGVTVEVRSPDQLNNLPDCDIAHLFNIQAPESTWAAFQAVQQQGIPAVLSPIYWDIIDHWFERAATERRRWRWLIRLLGRARVRRLYLAWQRRKAPRTTLWQTQRRLLAQAERLLPNSLSEARLLQDTFALNGDFQQKVDVIPNAIDPTLYQPAPEPDRDFMQKYGVRDFVLQVGTINPIKNQLGLIEALYDLPLPLVFIGPVQTTESDYAAACRGRAAARGNVHFIDSLPHGELPGIYAAAAVHALPSWRETPGLVSLEAAAAGCRVVTTAIGSAHDYFDNLAWYCYPDDFKSIRQAVEAALQAQPSTSLRQRVLTDFTWPRAAEATLASYQQVLNK